MEAGLETEVWQAQGFFWMATLLTGILSIIKAVLLLKVFSQREKQPASAPPHKVSMIPQKFTLGHLWVYWASSQGTGRGVAGRAVGASEQRAAPNRMMTFPWLNTWRPSPNSLKTPKPCAIKNWGIQTVVRDGWTLRCVSYMTLPALCL